MSKKPENLWWRAEPRFEGEKLWLGEHEVVVPALNFARIRKLMPVLQKIGAGEIGPEMAEGQMDDLIEVIHSAVTRNYPGLTKAELEEQVDFRNAPRLFLAIMGVSRLQPGEPAPGEAGPSIGENSMPG